jgi:type II secretory pathway component PulC
MPKISRPVVYTAVAAVALYAVFLNTQPDKPTAKYVSRVTKKTQTAASDDILPEDLKAHFPRYDGGARDPFVPGVVLARPSTSSSRTLSKGRSGWTLTGINSVNGVSSALIENGRTGESVFLQPGDRWNGLRVVAVKPDRVLFQNALGREDTLTFAQPSDDKAEAAGGTAVPAAPRLPGGGLSVPPYPVTPLRVTPLPPLPPLSGGGSPSDQ